MQHAARMRTFRDLGRRAYEAADAFFLSDATRRRSANQLAYTRIGIIGCFAVGVSTIVFIPWRDSTGRPES